MSTKIVSGQKTFNHDAGSEARVNRIQLRRQEITRYA